MREIVIANTQRNHTGECATLQNVCYPTLDASEKLNVDHFARHIELFPAGQFVALDARTGAVVGSTSGFLANVDTQAGFDAFAPHTFYEAIAGGWLTHHTPRGTHYYGIDMCVHPDYRGLGIARLLHDARKALCRNQNLRGQIVCGMIPGFASYKHALSARAYVDAVVAGDLHDSTLTTQLRNGFALRGMQEGYLHDSATEGWSTILEWRNPEHRRARAPARPPLVISRPRLPAGASPN